MELEFKRMNLDPTKWRLTTINQDYVKIPSYPATFIVPNDIPDSGIFFLLLLFIKFYYLFIYHYFRCYCIDVNINII